MPFQQLPFEQHLTPEPREMSHAGTERVFKTAAQHHAVDDVGDSLYNKTLSKAMLKSVKWLESWDWMSPDWNFTSNFLESRAVA